MFKATCGLTGVGWVLGYYAKWPGGLPCKFGAAYQARGLGIAPLKLVNLAGCDVAQVELRVWHE